MKSELHPKSWTQKFRSAVHAAEGREIFEYN